MVTCVICKSEVTAKDPVRYPYCKTCHYSGRAGEHLRSEQIAFFKRAFPDARHVGIDHTGGGCFRFGIYLDDENCYGMTDGSAGLPCDPVTEEDIIPGGWGVVFWESQEEEKWGTGEPDSFEILKDVSEVEGFWNDPKTLGVTDDDVVALVRADYERRQ